MWALRPPKSVRGLVWGAVGAGADAGDGVKFLCVETGVCGMEGGGAVGYPRGAFGDGDGGPGGECRGAGDGEDE
eukprot:CAMPEP_0201488216 /NCGR_PEP_ID=MMETSP0151_2-20130828/17728_1 /ASSEMBLY_ACC=CAM_ASM_000257 /TAXON_ID=200890 /ORGANISM="Paramoeba atlantica, Strain 621/1 / CCAP 1560/9" /LENGTH=73 /DNA_ID=CAMNT_0047873463 /DNA_START=11 /DNA_END=229 /DNA_ORIENTATION=-